MERYIITVVLIALLAAFILCLMRKWELIEHVQIHGNKFFAEMFQCNFCLSWWTGCVVAVVWAAVTRDPVVLTVPFCSTIITRYLL